jgi:hypothetical protein
LETLKSIFSKVKKKLLINLAKLIFEKFCIFSETPRKFPKVFCPDLISHFAKHKIHFFKNRTYLIYCTELQKLAIYCNAIKRRSAKNELANKLFKNITIFIADIVFIVSFTL